MPQPWSHASSSTHPKARIRISKPRRRKRAIQDDSDSSSSSSENESLTSSASSSSSGSSSLGSSEPPWASFARPVTHSQILEVRQTRSHYLRKVQASMYELHVALAGIIDEVEGRGWGHVRREMGKLVVLAERWSSAGTGEGQLAWKRVEIAALYSYELLEPFASQLNDRVYNASLGSEGFKAMIAVLRRLWPQLRATPLFTSSLSLTNDLIPSRDHSLRLYLRHHLLNISPSIITRFLAITLQRPDTRYESFDETLPTTWEALNLSRLGLGDNAGALRLLNLGLTLSLLKGSESGVDWRDEPFFLVDLSRNGLEYLPTRFRDFVKRTYALDVSHNPLIGLPDSLRQRAFDFHIQDTLRTKHTQLKNFVDRVPWAVPSILPTPTRGAAPLIWHAVKRIYASEADRQAALHATSETPLQSLISTAYECPRCDRLLISHPFFTASYMSHATIQLSPSGLAFGDRKCLSCALKDRGLWPAYAVIDRDQPPEP